LRSTASGRRHGWGGKQIAQGPAHCSDKSDAPAGALKNQTKEEMKKVLQQIQDGTLNQEWLSEYEKSGKDAFDMYMKQLDAHQIEQVG